MIHSPRHTRDTNMGYTLRYDTNSYVNNIILFTQSNV